MYLDAPAAGGSNLVNGLTNFVTAMMALSVASERVTETAKQFLGAALAKCSANMSSALTQVLAILSGTAVVAFSGTDPLQMVGAAVAPSAGQTYWLHLTVSGVLVSGGSAFWNHILDILKATKVQKEAIANTALGANPTPGAGPAKIAP
jgi:hypothetical protein